MKHKVIFFYKFINEMSLLIVALLISIFFGSNQEFTFDWVVKLQHTNFTYSTINIESFIALAVLVITTPNKEEHNIKYIRFYTILPYTILLLSHLVLWILQEKINILYALDDFKIRDLSNSLHIIEIVFAISFIVFSLLKKISKG